MHPAEPHGTGDPHAVVPCGRRIDRDLSESVELDATWFCEFGQAVRRIRNYNKPGDLTGLAVELVAHAEKKCAKPLDEGVNPASLSDGLYELDRSACYTTPKR